MDLNAELNAIIRDKLPEAVGSELRRELERLPKLEKQLEAERGSVEIRDARIKELQETLSRYKNLEEREQVVNKQAIEIAQRMQALTIQEAVQKAVEPYQRELVSNMKSIVESVFANSKYKYTEVSERQKAMIIPTGNGCGYSDTKVERDTKTIEETGKPG